MGNDPNQPATKGDLEGVRSDLKADIGHLDQKVDDVRSELKDELKAVEKKLVLGNIKTNTRMDKMEERLRADIRDVSHQVAGRIDSFLNRLETYDRESVTLPKTLDEHGTMLRDHEKRLTTIETKS